jgi:hypothetical protein
MPNPSPNVDLSPETEDSVALPDVFLRLAIVLEELSSVAARLERLGVSEDAVADGRYVERAQDIDRIVQGLTDTSSFARVLSQTSPASMFIPLQSALASIGQAALARQLSGLVALDEDPGEFELF